MICFLLSLAMLIQGLPAKPSESGTITGTLKTELGTPAVGVRVAALAVPESAAALGSASTQASLGETDAKGHFRLENIPPGRYYVTAGRVDYPTYFPGTQELASGRIITVKAGDTIPSIDFAMNSIAARPADSLIGSFFGGVNATPSLGIGINVKVEGGGTLPVFSSSGFVTLQFSRTSDGVTTSMPITAASMNVPIPTTASAPEYRVKVENLPNGYAVKSIAYGGSKLVNDTFKLTSNTPATATIYSRINAPIPATPAQTNVTITGANPGSTLTVILSTDPTSKTDPAGVRVTGKAKNSEIRSVYISGLPGTFYADGSFEFRGVPPGRHNISTPDNPTSSQPLAASIVVGNQDINGIELRDTPLLPVNIQVPTSPGPAGTHDPGSVLPLAWIRGQVRDEITHEPIANGTVFLTGHYGSSYQLDSDGRFEFSRLIPGSYIMEIHPFGHVDIRRTIVVEESDINLDLATPTGEGLIQ